MIDTKLILIEGAPCSGKSTTARNLVKILPGNGVERRCYTEWAENHPIAISPPERRGTSVQQS
jgi:thymidylate kinase